MHTVNPFSAENAWTWRHYNFIFGRLIKVSGKKMAAMCENYVWRAPESLVTSDDTCNALGVAEEKNRGLWLHSPRGGAPRRAGWVIWPWYQLISLYIDGVSGRRLKVYCSAWQMSAHFAAARRSGAIQSSPSQEHQQKKTSQTPALTPFGREVHSSLNFSRYGRRQ